MEWLLTVLGISLLSSGILMLFGSNVGRSRQPGRSTDDDDEPVSIEHLIPVEYDKELPKDVVSQFQNQPVPSLEEYQQARLTHQSAVLELNTAHIALDRIATRKTFLRQEPSYEDQSLVNNALQRANGLINHQPDRYPAKIKNYLEKLEERKDELGFRK